MTEDSTGTVEPKGELAIRTLAMPADANPSGDIFGGWLISQMDIAGGITAGARARGRVATIAVTGFTFHKPVLVGDVVSCYADIQKVGMRRRSPSVSRPGRCAVMHPGTASRSRKGYSPSSPWMKRATSVPFRRLRDLSSWIETIQDDKSLNKYMN